MKEHIKEDILVVAQQLFNEKGYRNTSMRDIAKALDISVGNLTYHFKKKEDLMFALLQLPDFASRPLESNYEELFDLFKAMLESLVVNEFFYVEDELGKCTEEFYQQNIDNVNAIEVHLKNSLKRLSETGYFVPWKDTEELNAFTKMIMYSHVTWIKHSFYRKKADTLSLEEMLEMHYALLECRVPENKKNAYAKVRKSFDHN